MQTQPLPVDYKTEKLLSGHPEWGKGFHFLCTESLKYLVGNRYLLASTSLLMRRLKGVCKNDV